MLLARSGRCQFGRVKRLKTQCLAGSLVVVCKIHQPPFLVPPALFPAISFHLLGVVLAIFSPIVRIRPAPLLWTLQADLLVYRIRGDLLPMIIGAALALASRLAANLLLRMIRRRLKNLLTVAATAVLHRATPEENRISSFSGNALKPEHTCEKRYGKFYRVLCPCPAGGAAAVSHCHRETA